MARKPTGKPNGRPPIEIDKSMFERLCKIFCTRDEIADIFQCDADTVSAWCLRAYGESFSAVYKKLSSEGKASLRRMQFKLAEKNAGMAIWLGKQYLGQSDDPAGEHDGAPVVINITRDGDNGTA